MFKDYHIVSQAASMSWTPSASDSCSEPCTEHLHEHGDFFKVESLSEGEIQIQHRRGRPKGSLNKRSAVAHFKRIPMAEIAQKREEVTS